MLGKVLLQKLLYSWRYCRHEFLANNAPELWCAKHWPCQYRHYWI